MGEAKWSGGTPDGDIVVPAAPSSPQPRRRRLLNRSGPINWKTNLFFVWLSQLLTNAGFYAVMPFIPIYFREVFGMDDERTRGMWVSTFNFVGLISFCFTQPLWGALADRYGRKMMLLRANYVTAVLFPCLMLAPSVGIMIAIRMLVSTFSGTTSAAQTLLVTTTPERHQGFALGFLASAVWSGSVVGFAVGGLMVGLLGFTSAFLVCGVLYLVGGVLVHVFVREDFVSPPPPPTPEPPADPSISGRLKAVADDVRKASGRFAAPLSKGLTTGVWMLLGLFVLVGAVRKFDEPFIAMLVERIHGHGDAAYYTGWISAVAAVGGIISGLVMGKLCDRYSAGVIVIPAVLISSASMLGQAYAATLVGLGAARFTTFLVAGGLDPAFQMLLARETPVAKRGAIFGWAQSLRMAGILIGTALGGVVIYHFGTQRVFVVGAGLYLLLLPAMAVALRYVRRR